MKCGLSNGVVSGKGDLLLGIYTCATARAGLMYERGGLS